ncbi:MAG: DUF692 domain-containing protein [Pseudomonadota bacterium]
MSPTLPIAAGTALKPEHYAAILAEPPGVGFFEVHAENFFCAGGPRHRWLTAFRERHALSMHGVGLSLGGADAPDAMHLARLRELLLRYEPQAFSEHLAWSNGPQGHLNDLLPLPYTQESLALVSAHVDQVQNALGRRILIENPATYLRYRDDGMGEVEFLRELAARSGCGLLLDLNNVHVSATNHGYDALDYLRAFPLQAVGEIHLAGHAQHVDADGRPLLIDSHDAPVDAAVWSLYEACLQLTGPLPTLVEWDSNLPTWHQLLDEAAQAQRRLDAARLAQQGAAA